MNVDRIAIVESPERPRHVRLSAEVTYDDRSLAPERYWFELSAEHADALSASGNAWLACLLPLAATRREPLRVAAPVDRALLERAPDVMRIWRSWYPQLAVVAVEAEPLERTGPARRKTAALFSGGVDSSFTALRPRAAEPAEHRVIDDLVTVWGFDVPLDATAAFGRLRAQVERVAAGLGKGFVAVATNLRVTRWRDAAWGPLAHGAALAAVGLVLERRYERVLIAATGGYRDLHPWGSHPLTDPLFSTAATAIVHDGAAFTREQKLELLARSPVALETLRVCWRSASDANCGACNKCLRTMTQLELLGALERCDTLPRGPVDLERLARVYCAHPWDFREFSDIRRLALERGRRDVARAAARAMRRSRRLALQLALVRALGARPLLGRWAAPLERRLLARAVP
jgi:hypothetical protein